MLFSTGSLLLVGLIELYLIYIGFQKRTIWPRRAGVRLTAASAVLGGLAFGTILAQSFDISLDALLGFAMLFGAAAGTLGGAAYGLLPAANGGLAGTITAMLGTVLGSLFFGSSTVVLASALLFIACAFLLQRAADRSSAGGGGAATGRARAKAVGSLRKKTAERRMTEPISKPSYRSAYVLGACAALLFAGILLLQDRLQLGAIGLPQTQAAVMDDENDLQVATIDVTGAGFAPKVTEFQANAMIKVIFNVKASAGNGLKIVSKDLNFSADVKPGRNIFLLNNPQPGDYTIEVDGKDNAGTFTVKPAAAKL